MTTTFFNIVRGNKSSVVFTFAGDITARNLFFTAKLTDDISATRIIDKTLTSKIYVSPNTTVTVNFFPADTDTLAKGVYYYEITSVNASDATDSVTIASGEFELQSNIRTPYDGILPTPANVVVADLTDFSDGDLLQVSTIDGVKTISHVAMPVVGNPQVIHCYSGMSLKTIVDGITDASYGKYYEVILHNGYIINENITINQNIFLIFNGVRVSPHIQGLTHNYAKYTGANLAGLWATDCSFQYTSFVGANLAGAQMVRCNFSFCNFSGANLETLYCIGSRFFFCTMPRNADTKEKFKALVGAGNYDATTTIWTDGNPIGA